MELFRALALVTEPPTAATARVAAVLGLGRAPTADEYTDLFVLQLYPYASVYLGAEGMLGGEARDRIAGFWRALGDDPPREPDHLALLLAAYARLAELETGAGAGSRREAAGRARAAFLWEHLLSWLPFWIDRVVAIGPPPYRRWGRLLARTLAAEALRDTPPDRLPLHLRAADAPSEDPEPPADLVAGLLAPARSGIILTRADLVAAAAALGLGLRAGERRFALRALMEQDPPRVLAWFGETARRAARRHMAHRPVVGGIAEWWRDRARGTAALLRAAAIGAAPLESAR